MNIEQTVFPFKLEMEKNDSSVTSFGGLPLFNEMFHQLKLPKEIERHLNLKASGWTESEIIETIGAMVIAGGEHMSDVDMLLQDKAYQKIIRKKKGLPGAKAIERFLKFFTDDRTKPEEAKAWIIPENKNLKKLGKVSKYLAKKLLKAARLNIATLECDATISFSHKVDAYKTYKGGTGYAPMIGSIAEIGIIVEDEFRDGNVPSNFKAYEFVNRCTKIIPLKTKIKRARFDGHFYQHDIIRILNEKGYEWSITAMKTDNMIEVLMKKPEQDWKPLDKMTEYDKVDTGRDWIEFSWVSASNSQKDMDSRMYRYIATRKRAFQLELFDGDADRYEVIVTNMDWRGDRLINWHYERCGSVEPIFKVLKAISSKRTF